MDKNIEIEQQQQQQELDEEDKDDYSLLSNNKLNSLELKEEENEGEEELINNNEQIIIIKRQQQQNLMQLCLASNNLEGQQQQQQQQHTQYNNENEDNEEEDEDEEEEEEEEEMEDEECEEEEEEERINENDKNYKFKALKRLNEELDNKNEISTVQSLIAAAAAASSSSSPPPSSTVIIDRTQSSSSSSKKSRIAAIPGKPRGATYDGNSCMICSDRASGFHYGVLACEGCKGFFKRICKEPNEMQNKRHCVYGGNCDINLRTRNRCQYCRIQKCIQLGMSKDGIKLGRRSRKFKENLVHIVSSSSLTTSTSSTATTSTSMSSLNTQTSTSSLLSTNQNIMSSYQDHHHNHHHHQITSTSGGGGGVKLISQMSDNKSNDRQQQQQQHSNSLINHQNIIISNNGTTTTSNNQLIAINTGDNQIQQFLIPTTSTDQSTSNNKQVIAIIQDNKLILKTIDIPTSALISQQQQQQQQNNNNNNNNIIQIQPTTVINSNNNNNMIQLSTSTSTQNIIQLIPKNDYQTTKLSTATNFNLDNQFNNNNRNQNSNNFNPMHKLAVAAAAAAAASSSSTINNESPSSYTLPELSQINHTNELILGAHKDTWPYLKDKSKKLKSQFNMKKNTSLEQLFSKGLLQLLKDTKFLEYFNSLIENTVLFAKIVPYFMEMHETDRITLLKSSVFEIICIRHSQLFDLINNKFILPLYEANLSKEFLIQKLPECKTFIELLFDFINEFSLLDLSDLEIAVFCSFLLFNTDDDVQLNDSDKLINYRNLYRGLLIHELNKNHSKFNNNNFTIQNWLNTCCMKLKKLNQEHSQILSRLKKSIQFPDLYAELYNL